ncbi:4a-hydroxytetrahydrobiopterin dehydratase [Gammaproteobacteria bacterium]|nr:4a-hydroxytetrahydrobiopterin dehydratase [Gammaproteobacteria bacterium]
MNNLTNQTCAACEIGAPLVPESDQAKLLEGLDGWEIDNTTTSKLVNKYKFLSYKEASTFVNLIVDLAESEDHHPKITLEWGLVHLEWWSHKIKGLHMNDFICAAKSNQLFQSL